MKNISLFIAVLLLLSVSGCREQPVQVLKAGKGVVEITPPIGYYHYRGTSTGVHDPLYAKALVFEQGETTGAILVCDILSIPGDLSRAVRERASKQTGIPFSNITIAATHTHTGPSIRQPLRRYFEGDQTVPSDFIEGENYIETLINRMTGAIVQAAGNMKDMEIYSGISAVEGISFNRRFLMTDGRVRFNPGILNPRIVGPVGPNDPDYHYLLLREPGQEEFSASFSVFANHLDTRGGNEYAADYPYYLGESLRNHFGSRFTSIFALGTCGDINHVDVTRAAEDTRRLFITQKIGEKLASAMAAGASGLSPGNPSLGIISQTLYLPLQEIPDTTEIFNERAFLIQRRKMKAEGLEYLRKHYAVPPSSTGDPWRLPVEIHAFRIDSNTAIVTMPGEILVGLGLDLKKRSPFVNTMVIELANLDIAYIPTLQAFDEGDYEAINSRLTPGSGEAMIDEAVRMLEKLKN